MSLCVDVFSAPPIGVPFAETLAGAAGICSKRRQLPRSAGVHRTANAERTAVQDVGIDLRGLDAGVTHELLDGTNIAARFEQVRGQAVPECVARRRLADAGRTNSTIRTCL